MYLHNAKGEIIGGKDERLFVTAITKSMCALAAELGDAYTAICASDPSATDADFFYLRNLDDRDLHIFKIKAWLDDGCTGDVHEISVKTGVTGSPTSGTTVTPVNLKANSGRRAKVTCEHRDGDMALTGGSTVDIIRLFRAATVNGSIAEKEFKYDPEIILPYGEALILNNDVDPVGVDFDVIVWFYFHSRLSD